MACDGVGDQSLAFGEVVRVIGRELQNSKERIRQLEDAFAESQSRIARASVNSEAASHLLERAVSAEAREVNLKKELEDAQIKLVKQNLRIEDLEKQVVKLRALKREEEIEQSKLKKQLEHSQEERAMQNLRMSHLQDQLGTMHALQQEAKEVAALRENEKFLYLEEKISSITAENEALSATVSRLEREKNNAIIRLKNIESDRNREMPWPVEKYTPFCGGDGPAVQNRPDYSHLKPVCWADDDQLKRLIKMDKQLDWVIDKYICLPLPELLVWTSTTCRVGLAFSPMRVFAGPYWKESSLSEHTGPVEVFFRSDGKMYYAGSYIKESMRKHNPQGCTRGDNHQAARFLSERSFAPLTCAKSDHTIKTLLESLYSDGLLRAECTILRCVGFNHYVHDSLSAQYDGARALQNRITSYRR